MLSYDNIHYTTICHNVQALTPAHLTANLNKLKLPNHRKHVVVIEDSHLTIN